MAKIHIMSKYTTKLTKYINLKKYTSLINKSQQFFLFLFHTLKAYKITYAAAMLTFTTLLSLVPLLSVSFSIVGSLNGFEQVEGQIKEFIFTNLIPSSAHVMQQNLHDLINQAGKLSFMGSIILVITAVITLSTVERAFNEIWGVKKARSGISAFMLYWAVLTLAPLCLGASLGFSSYLISLSVVSDATATIGGKGLVLAITSFLLQVIAFTLLYVAVPNCKVSYRLGLIGGVIVATAFELSKKLFAVYISNFTSYELLYGALASIPIILIWIYVTWLIILFGAEIVYALANYGHYNKNARHPFVISYLCLGHVYLAHRQGASISLMRLQQLMPQENSGDIEYVLGTLINLGLLYKVEAGEYILGRELANFTLKEFYDILPWKLPATGSEKLPGLSKALSGCDLAMQKHLEQPLSATFVQDLQK